jgi:transposase
MPWKVGTMSELHLSFVQEIVVLHREVRATCRKYGISRKTGYKWLVRYRGQGTDAMENRSRRPKHSPRRTGSTVEEEVLRVRDQYGWGAPKIWAYLRNEAEARGQERVLPSERTLGNILRRHGRVVSTEASPTAPPQFFERSQPHSLWQCDFKGPLEVERQRVYPFTVLDDHSRYLLALRVCLDVTMKSAWEVLWGTFAEHGLPESLLCDNAFGASHGGLRTVSWFEARLIRLGIHVLHGRAYHPQTQGKVERLHGTLAKEVWPFVDRGNREAFGTAIDRWRREVYNPVRPHESLEGRPPLSRFGPNPRKRPAQLPEVSYPATQTLRKVANGGDISWRGYRILVGAGVSGETVGVEDRDNEVSVHYGWKKIRGVPHAKLAKGRLL